MNECVRYRTLCVARVVMQFVCAIYTFMESWEGSLSLWWLAFYVSLLFHILLFFLHFATRCEDGRACREWIISCVTTSSVCTHHSKWKSVVECISKKMNKTARGRWCAGRSGSACVVVDGICCDTLDSTCLQWTQLDEICVTCRLASLSCPRERLRPTRYPRR